MRRTTVTTAVGTGLLLLLSLSAACDRPAGELAGPTPDVRAAATGAVSDDSVQDRILFQGTDQPPLETYAATFAAVAGESQTFEIRYDVPVEMEEPSPVFFRLDLDKETLKALPDGTPVESGDTVFITATVDRKDRLEVDLEPTGLRFDADKPARLRLMYLRANPDFNGDGVVDAADSLVETNGLHLFFKASDAAPWNRLQADQDLTSKRFEADIRHFSRYAIAW